MCLFAEFYADLPHAATRRLAEAAAGEIAERAAWDAGPGWGAGVAARTALAEDLAGVGCTLSAGVLGKGVAVSAGASV